MSEKTPTSQLEPEPAPERPVIAVDDDPARSGLLANISHELRTPLDAILGYAELLSDTPLNDTQQTFISAIERAGKGLLDIMDDVLNLSRMEAGKLEIHNQPFSIRDCVDSVSQMLAPSAYAKGLDFVRLVDHDVPVNFIGDPLRIRQILVNLVGNAIKFTKTGSVRLSVKAHPFDERRYELVMRVIDSGIGISPHDLTKLFQPFSQPAKPQGDISGTGLGLVISKSLCETMGGSIAVHSAIGEGSAFCVQIPLESMEQSYQTGDDSDLLAQRSVVVVCADTELAGWIAENLRQDGAKTRIVLELTQLARAVNTGQCDDDIAVCVIGAKETAETIKLARDWQLASGKLPILCLVNSVAGHTLRKVTDALAGDAIPAHSSASTINRHIATLLQKHRASRQQESRSDCPVAQPLTGLHLLVAEDNQFGRDYLQMLLNRHGATVDVCCDGLDACKLIAEHHYDLVLMDVRMPQCDGIEAMSKLAASGRTLPPIIGLTAAPEECCRALNSGMTDCLLKPIRPAVLLKYITNHQGKTAEPQARPLSFIDAEMRHELNRELPQRAAQLLQAITRGDMDGALDAAHKINGTAALCGFPKLHATAASIEGLIRQQHLDGIERLTRELGAQIDEALATLITT